MAEHNLPTRTMTSATDEDAIPDEDTSEVTKLFMERLQAWKHACGYLEDYVTSTEKMQHAHAKEYEKVLKTVSSPLKEAHHFEQQLGGVAGLLDTIRVNTQGISNSHAETAKTLKASVLPIFERLHTEIKNKSKEIHKGAGKGGKLVDKARATSQKHIELLGQHTASYESAGGKMSAHEDPYILHRGVYHRLNKQINEENNNRQDILAVQNNFATFETHILQTIQNGLSQFNQIVGNQAETTRTMYGNISNTATQIPPDFEWNGFVQRNNAILIDPSAPARSIENVNFPNQGHKATQPLLAGSLERKGKMLKRYENAYWVITPSKYMHEFKTDDDFAKDPTPETSIYLPDCVVGALDGSKFNVKGKNVSKSSFSNKLSMSHEYSFKAHTPSEGEKWWETIKSVAGESTNEMPATTAPSSPSESRQASASYPEQSAIEGSQATNTAATNNSPYAATGPSEGVSSADNAYPTDKSY